MTRAPITRNNEAPPVVKIFDHAGKLTREQLVGIDTLCLVISHGGGALRVDVVQV
jgi:hypothetical protein